LKEGDLKTQKWKSLIGIIPVCLLRYRAPAPRGGGVKEGDLQTKKWESLSGIIPVRLERGGLICVQLEKFPVFCVVFQWLRIISDPRNVLYIYIFVITAPTASALKKYYTLYEIARF
jgi:hypothetical protein